MFFKSHCLATAALICFCTLATSAQAGQLFPPNNIGQNPNVSCPNGELLTWHGDRVDCTSPTPGVTVSCPAGQVLTGITNGVPVCTSIGGACVARYANSSTKIACGLSSSVSCEPGEYVLAGGFYGGGNDQLQSSYPANNGWYITAYDVNGSGSCTQNYIENGTVASGNPPQLGDMTGGAVAYCCH